MRKLFLVSTVLALACGAAAAANSTSRSSHSAASRLLAAHNAERARMGVRPLQWDPALAASAAAYGPTLARLGRLKHSPKTWRPGERENLWMGTRGAFSPEQMVGNWISEKAYYRPGTFPRVSRTGRWDDVAHYTQVVWSGTTRVGCAIHSDGRWDYLICRYSPPGNIEGYRVI
jgi:hypothetical protein